MYLDITVITARKVKITAELLGCFPNLLKIKCTSCDLDLRSFASCSKLIGLALSSCPVTTLDGIGVCSSLRKLRCSKTPLHSLGDIGLCKALCKLYILQHRLPSLEGLRGCSNLEELYCTDSQLGSLQGLEGCVNLLKLVCSRNRLSTTTGLESCVKLRYLRCSSNRLETLDGLECCLELEHLICPINSLTSLTCLNSPALKVLDCSNNRIRSINGTPSNLGTDSRYHPFFGRQAPSSLLTQVYPSLERLIIDGNWLPNLNGLHRFPALTHLDCNANYIDTIKHLAGAPLLTSLSCNRNRLVMLTGIEHCTLLETLVCSRNRLITLAGIEYCTSIQAIDCEYNQLQRLDQTVYLLHLRSIVFAGNPLATQTRQVRRALTRHSVYNNNQNVHDLSIQRSICESVLRLLLDPEPEFSFEDVLQSGLDEKTVQLLLEFCSDDNIYSVHLLTYTELLSYVWARIMRSEHRSELLAILAEQVSDAECKCATGRFNRTLSVLAGFCPDIVIEISDCSRIGAIIIAAKARTVPYSALAHRQLANRMLLEAGYGNEEIELWLDAIEE